MGENKNKVGRPRKYTNVSELEQMIDEYFKYCDKTHRPYTITGLALFLDMDRRTLLRYEKDYEDEFCPTITRAKERVQEFVECCLFKKGIAQGVIFNLKNNFGWEDKQEVDHTITELQKDKNAISDIASQIKDVNEDDIDASI